MSTGHTQNYVTILSETNGFSLRACVRTRTAEAITLILNTLILKHDHAQRIINTAEP